MVSSTNNYSQELKNTGTASVSILLINRYPLSCLQPSGSFTSMEADHPETPHSLDDQDTALIAAITPDVMACLGRSKFFEMLDDRLCPADKSIPPERCRGAFEVSELILRSQGYDEAARTDIFDVLKSQGGFCDCEILYNVPETNRLKAEYWQARAKEVEQSDAQKPTE